MSSWASIFQAAPKNRGSTMSFTRRPYSTLRHSDGGTVLGGFLPPLHRNGLTGARAGAWSESISIRRVLSLCDYRDVAGRVSAAITMATHNVFAALHNVSRVE